MSKIKYVPLHEVATFMGGSTPHRQNNKYFGGTLPWVKTTDLNNSFIVKTEETLTELGLKESSCKMIDAGAVLVAMYGGFNQIGRTGVLTQKSAINQALTAVIPDPKKLNPIFLNEWLNYRVKYWIRFAVSSRKDPNITKSDVEDFPVPLLNIDYQNKAVDILQNWTNSIKTTERLIEAKQRYVDGFSSKLIHNPLFSKIHVHQIASEFSIRNKDNCIRVLSVTNKNGFVLPEDRFERRVASENVSNYKLVQKGQYAYNPSRINVGSIARLDEWDEGILSPMYTIFEIDESQVNSDFFLHWLSSYNAKQRIKKSAQGSVRETVSFGDFGAIPIPFPSIDDQRKIAEILNTAKREIDLLKSLAASYRVQKRGLMQKLLSGEWRVAG